MQILASGKTGAQRYDDNNVAKPVPDLDFIEIGQQTKRAFEETQGWSYSNNKGSTDSQATDLSIIEEGDVSDYDASFAQLIQTYVSNNSYLEVKGSSTANNIILEPRKIADVNSPNGTNYAKTTSLPFTFRDNLKFVFRATDTNTGAVQFSITGLSGLSGAIDSTNENGDALTGGEIVSGKFYEIITTGTATTKKVILRQPTVREASTTEKGTSYIPNPITISNNVDDADHDIDFTAGNFNFFDSSGQATMTAKTGELDAAFGTGNGMLDTGTIASDSTYHLFTVYNPTTGDSKPLASLSKTSPTMTLPNADGYTVLGKRIAALRTDGSANIRSGSWLLGAGVYEFSLSQNILINSAAVGTTRTPLDMEVPAGSIVRFNSNASSTSGTLTRTYFTNLDSVDISPGNSTGNHVMVNNNFSSSGQIEILTNSSGEIGARSDNASSANLYVITEGWKEYL